MKAALWYKSGDIRIEDIPEPSPCAGEVKIKVKWCGICGSDLHEFTMGPIIHTGGKSPSYNAGSRSGDNGA